MFSFIRAQPIIFVRLGPVILVILYQRGSGCPICGHVGRDLEHPGPVEDDPAHGKGAGLGGPLTIPFQPKTFHGSVDLFSIFPDQGVCS